MGVVITKSLISLYDERGHHSAGGMICPNTDMMMERYGQVCLYVCVYAKSLMGRAGQGRAGQGRAGQGA